LLHRGPLGLSGRIAWAESSLPVGSHHDVAVVVQPLDRWQGREKPSPLQVLESPEGVASKHNELLRPAAFQLESEDWSPHLGDRQALLFRRPVPVLDKDLGLHDVRDVAVPPTGRHRFPILQAVFDESFPEEPVAAARRPLGLGCGRRRVDPVDLRRARVLGDQPHGRLDVSEPTDEPSVIRTMVSEFGVPSEHVVDLSGDIIGIASHAMMFAPPTLSCVCRYETVPDRRFRA
jgi:hypothetical protein